MYNIDIQDDARDDMKEIELYYKSINAAIFESFKKELYRILDLLSTFPLSFQFAYKNIRVAYLQKFSYIIYYEVREKEVVVHAILHTSQERSEDIK